MSKTSRWLSGCVRRPATIPFISSSTGRLYVFCRRARARFAPRKSSSRGRYDSSVDSVSLNAVKNYQLLNIDKRTIYCRILFDTWPQKRPEMALKYQQFYLPSRIDRKMSWPKANGLPELSKPPESEPMQCIQHLYSQSNNKTLAIANRSRVSCAHAQHGDGIYGNPVTLKSRLTVTQGHWKRNHWVDHTRLTTSRVIGR